MKCLFFVGGFLVFVRLYKKLSDQVPCFKCAVCSFRAKDWFNRCKSGDFGFVFLFLVLLLVHGAMIQANVVYAEADSISDSVLRLRVVANSDSEEDQDLKLAFKSQLCEVLKPYLNDCADADTAVNWIEENLDFVQEQADSICRKLSINSCSVNFTKSNFPIRTYGNLTFPPGNYRTLLVTLGSGQGQNWWCVLYPSLCFTSESTANFPQEAQEKLQNTLSEEDYETISQGITFRFKIAEIVGKLLTDDK